MHLRENGITGPYEIALQRPDGTNISCINNATPVLDEGGTLTITCRNAVIDDASAAANTDARAGEFAVLSVRDTGTGMSEDVKSRILEPFFTTKDFGKGSGLGLSMVCGFVRQSGGHITINSAPGAGTEILLYLPRAHTDADESSVANDQGLLRETLSAHGAPD